MGRPQVVLVANHNERRHILQLAQALEDVLSSRRSVERELVRLARWTVGRLGIKEAVSALRGEMVRHGLERENRLTTGAGRRLLGNDLQHGVELERAS